LAEEGIALLEKAAGQGQAYAMFKLGADVHANGNEHELSLGWITKAAEAGLPPALHSLGMLLDEGVGGVAPDCPAAAGWYRRAAAGGDGDAAMVSHAGTSVLGWSAWYELRRSGGGGKRGFGFA